jgi:nitroreductase
VTHSNSVLANSVLANSVLETIRNRRHAGALMLDAPGPDDGQLNAILEAAIAAPDHGKIMPFRLVTIPAEQREAFTALSLAAFRSAVPDGDEFGLKKARGKAEHPPCIVALIACFQPEHPKVGMPDQWLTVGCALQNLWLAAESLGFACGVSSGRLLDTDEMKKGFKLSQHEQLVSVISIGTPKERMAPRPKPSLADAVRAFGS